MERKRKIRNIIVALVLLLAAAAMAALPMLLKNAQEEAPDTASVLSVRAERGDIRSTISGGGTLTDPEGAVISVPRGVEITGYYTANGRSVAEGDAVAAVDKVSVMTTIATIQENLKYLEGELQKSRTAVTAQTLTAPLPGRVKTVYAQPGEKAADVMLRDGALCEISLDGRMAVTLEADRAPEPGSAVTVTLPDGQSLPGRVERRQGRKLTVTLTDNGPRTGDAVTVSDADGNELGRGELFVHSAWHLTASSGTVSRLLVQPEQQVWAGSGLVLLDNISGDGTYERLSGQHREYEDTMRELFGLYTSGSVTAPAAGQVRGLDEARLGVMRAGEGGYRAVFLSNPGEPGESAYVSRPARVEDVRFGRMILLAAAEPEPIADYTAKPAVDETAAVPVILTSFSGVSVFGYDKETGTWNTIYASDLTAGDMVYLVYDEAGNLVWVVRPVEQTIPVIPDVDMGGFYGGGGTEEPFELYDLTRRPMMEVVPQDTLTVKVTVDEMDILSVAQGQEAEITVPALPGRAYTGTVTHIDPNGVNQGGNTKYTITITMDRRPEMLTGLNATAVLTVGVTRDVLTLPAEAFTEKGSKTLVYLGCDPQTRELLLPTEVTTGVSDGQTVEILSGITEGTEVWYRYYESGGVPELINNLPGRET